MFKWYPHTAVFWKVSYKMRMLRKSMGKKKYVSLNTKIGKGNNLEKEESQNPIFSTL